MHASVPIVPAPSTTTVPGSASGLSRNAWMQVATGSASTATSASSSSSMTWMQRRRHRDELAEPARAAFRRRARGAGRCSPTPNGSQATSAGDLRVHRHAAADERLGPGRRRRHLADQLVPHDQRRRPARAPGRDALDVAAADPGALDAGSAPRPRPRPAARRRGRRACAPACRRGAHQPRPATRTTRPASARRPAQPGELLGLEVLVGDVALREPAGPADDPGQLPLAVPGEVGRGPEALRAPSRGRRSSRQSASVRTAGWSSGTSSGGK